MDDSEKAEARTSAVVTKTNSHWNFRWHYVTSISF